MKKILETTDSTLASLVESALRKKEIQFTVLGKSDVGIGGPQLITISVSENDEKVAMDIINSIRTN